MDIWSILQTLEGDTLYTLDPARSCPFTIERVSGQGVSLRTVGGSHICISRERILDCWSMLIRKHEVSLNIDMHVKSGLGRSASYVAAIFAHAPGIIIHTKPIVLKYH